LKMGILILFFVIVFSIGIIIPSQNVESILENDNYSLEGNGFLISDKNIESSKISIDFSIKDSVAGKTLQFEEGNILFAGNEFKILDNFKARLLKDGNLFRFNGETMEILL
jgi:ABC-type uncharacterized transport system permease subunit